LESFGRGLACSIYELPHLPTFKRKVCRDLL